MLRLVISYFLCLLFFAGIALADSESLTVTSCTATSCSTTNYNSNSTSIGATLAKNAADTLGWSDTASLGSGDTINNVYFGLRMDGATGISGNTNLVFEPVGGGTDYCTASIANTATDTSFTVEPSSCSWTKARLDDLQVVITNADGGSSTNNDYLYAVVTIDYTPVAAGSSCTYTSGDWNILGSDSCFISSSVDVGGNSVYVTGPGSFTIGSGGRIHNFANFVCKDLVCNADEGQIG